MLAVDNRPNPSLMGWVGHRALPVAGQVYEPVLSLPLSISIRLLFSVHQAAHDCQGGIRPSCGPSLPTMIKPCIYTLR